jgi:predicted ribosomally synthesized peptide with SipW-like signal peptide
MTLWSGRIPRRMRPPLTKEKPLMRKAKAVRVAGFFGALCASAALVGVAAGGTGAYFTDSHDGTINATTGRIQVNVDPANGALNYTDLLPGEYQSQRINYTAQPRGGTEDIWLVFPGNADGSDAFTQVSTPGPTPLGRYGHFGLTSSAGASFISNNLSLDPAAGGSYNTGESCSIDGNGHGGSTQTASDPSDHTVKYCAPMKAILLQSNMGAGEAGYADLSFGFTKILTAPQNTNLGTVEKFKVVATQHGVRPDDPSNG